MRRIAVCVVSLVIVALWVPSAHATLPGTNGHIAFSSFRDGNFEIYSMPSDDGSPETNLTTDAEDDYAPPGRPTATGSRS
jgi:hypothetical protein